MPGFARSSAPIAGSSPSASSLLSIGSLIIHDSVRCDVLRSSIERIGPRSLAAGQPNFLMSRLTLQVQLTRIEEEDRINSRTNVTGTANTSATLEYIDAQIHLSDSMSLPEAIKSEPLCLADALAGDKHYERIVRGGTALCTDLKQANMNREEQPKPRSTGGFIVKEGGAPIVGMLGAQWIDPSVNAVRNRRTGKHGRTESSTTSASAPLEPIHESSMSCSTCHWVDECGGSGTGTITFQLCPSLKCSSCGIRPLQMVHLASKKGTVPRTPTALSARNLNLLPNKAFKLVCHLLSMDNEASQPEVFFAHVRIVFYFTDDKAAGGAEGGCCHLKKHVFTASIEIGKEGDQQVKEKKRTDFEEALDRLEGKGKSPTVRRPTGRRLRTE